MMLDVPVRGIPTGPAGAREFSRRKQVCNHTDIRGCVADNLTVRTISSFGGEHDANLLLGNYRSP